MKIYIAVSFKDGNNDQEIDRFCKLVHDAGHEDFCFVRDVKDCRDDHELMQRDLEEVAKCDAFLINYDGPSDGRMIEMGMAYALGKKIIIITRKGTHLKDTVSGVADLIIEYDDLAEVVQPLLEFA